MSLTERMRGWRYGLRVVLASLSLRVLEHLTVGEARPFKRHAYSRASWRRVAAGIRLLHVQGYCLDRCASLQKWSYANKNVSGREREKRLWEYITLRQILAELGADDLVVVLNDSTGFYSSLPPES